MIIVRATFFFLVLFSIGASGQSLQVTNPTYLQEDSVILYDLNCERAKCGHLLLATASNEQTKVNYFSAGDAVGDYIEWAKHHQPLALFSGGYEDEGRPIGLTLNRGVVVSRSLEADMDALILIYPSGRLEILDIGSCFSLPDQDTTRQFCLHKSAIDRRDFLQWASLEGITAFQSHLLAYGNKLRITAEASPKLAKRRILMTTRKGSDSYYAVVDMEQASDLFAVSHLLMKSLPEHEILTMVNLDVGVNDILHIYHARGRELSEPRQGKVLRAVNLMVLYYSNGF